jgi:hypothetical protein
MCLCDVINYLWAVLLVSLLGIIVLANYDAYMHDDDKGATEVLVSKTFRSNKLRIIIFVIVFAFAWWMFFLCVQYMVLSSIRYTGHAMFVGVSRIGRSFYSPAVEDIESRGTFGSIRRGDGDEEETALPSYYYNHRRARNFWRTR